VQPVLVSAENAIKEEAESIQKLASIASNHPYYKYVLWNLRWNTLLIRIGTMGFGQEMCRM